MEAVHYGKNQHTPVVVLNTQLPLSWCPTLQAKDTSPVMKKETPNISL
jgi:hypothetical protein